MVPEQSSRAGMIWAYAYQLVPPQPEGRLHAVKALLDREHADVTPGTRTWEGRLVLERQVTHILVVTDSPDQDCAINRLLEAELKQMETTFALTVPLAVVAGGAGPLPDGEQLPAVK
jgi:hypothetical protein